MIDVLRKNGVHAAERDGELAAQWLTQSAAPDAEIENGGTVPIVRSAPTLG
jgi:hypothetical protein